MPKVSNAAAADAALQPKSTNVLQSLPNTSRSRTSTTSPTASCGEPSAMCSVTRGEVLWLGFKAFDTIIRLLLAPMERQHQQSAMKQVKVKLNIARRESSGHALGPGGKRGRLQRFRGLQQLRGPIRKFLHTRSDSIRRTSGRSYLSSSTEVSSQDSSSQESLLEALQNAAGDAHAISAAKALAASF
jgi:hypothetical protein